ncbi:type IV pilus modification PilV family protein [Thalassotalea sp. PLHSN55]|uniref:type IV pilus modification PilV family protein n=1 Tax=Thalassotalea sp. PLHSN55 TaxID=3435888 RepID=UPI003F874E1B
MPYKTPLKNMSQHKGFTLIEVIIGIVVLSISLAVVSTLINPTEEHSADQIHQIKAAELAQGLMDEILAKAFDENSDHAGGLVRCGEPADGSNNCAGISDDGESRANFDDVDDYNGYQDLVTATESGLDGSYNTFTLSVNVAYGGAELGINNTLAKRITVSVTTPLGTEIAFTSYKGNY